MEWYWIKKNYYLTDESINRSIQNSELTTKKKYKWMNQQPNEIKDGWLKGWKDEYKGWMNGWMNEYKGWMKRWKDEYKGWLKGWKDEYKGWLNGWKDEYTSTEYEDEKYLLWELLLLLSISRNSIFYLNPKPLIRLRKELIARSISSPPHVIDIPLLFLKHHYGTPYH